MATPCRTLQLALLLASLSTLVAPSRLAAQPVADPAPEPIAAGQDGDQVAEQDAGPAKPMAAADLDERIRALGAPDLETRDSAQLALATSENVTLDQIEQYLDTAELSPEQRLRLSAVGLSLFLDAPHPAMGVEFGIRMASGNGVSINNTVPGFDAANSLAAGDIILRMDGVEILDFAHARQVILSYDPDDQITVSVLRNGEPVDALVRFGTFKQLPNPETPTNDVLAQAWNIRRARRAPDRAEPVVVALDGSLVPNDPALAPQVAARAWRAVAQWIARRVGEPQDGFDGAYADTDQAEEGPDIASTGAQRTIDDAAAQPFSNRAVTPEVAAQLRQIDARLSALNRENRVAQQQILDPNLRADRRIELTNRIRAIQAEMSRLREWRRKMIGP